MPGANLPGTQRSSGTVVSPASEHAHGGRGDARTAAITAGAAAQAGAENFPVALRALPARYRRHLMAVYRFARTVDDVGDAALPLADQSARAPGDLATDRLRLLDELDDDLGRLYRGQAPRLEVIGQLAATVAECGLPRQPLRDLIQANRQDQLVSRYQTFGDLAGYCELSANPVGRIVLYVFGVHTPRRAVLSDHVCTALQLAEHWQDVAEDLRAGRIYLPAEDLDRFGCTPQDLAEPAAGPAVRALMSFQVARASALLSAGSPLIATLRGGARLAVAGYVAGGRAALAAIENARYDVLAATPRPAKRRLAVELARAYARGR
jgi:squalene synthase HpnC